MADFGGEIDFTIMLEQEPAFKDYVQETLLGAFLADPDFKELLKSIHAFYQIGMTTDQVTRWIKSMKRN